MVPNSPWFDEEYKRKKKERRKAEIVFKKSKAVRDHEFIKLRKETTDLLYFKKRDYYTNKLRQGNSKTLYSVVNHLLDKKQDVVLPTASNDKELADGFATYFSEKITQLQAGFKDSKSFISQQILQVYLN